MALWYNDPKKDETFAKLGGSFSGVNTEITWLEAAIHPIDNGTYVYGIAEKATDVQKYGDKAFDIDHHYIALFLHDKEYERKGEKQQPTKLELWLNQYLNQNYKYGCFKGLMVLIDNATACNTLLTGEKPKGGQASREYLNDLTEQFLQLEEIEPDKLKGLDFTNEVKTGFSSSKNSYRSQTERQKLDDRYSFISHHFGSYGRESAIEMSEALLKLKEQSPELYYQTIEILHYCLNNSDKA